MNKAPQAKPQKALAKWGHAVPAAALMLLALIVILVAPKVLNRLQGQPRETAAAEPAEPALPAAGEKPQAARSLPQAAAKEPGASSTAQTAPPVRTPVTAMALPRNAAASEVVHQVVPNVPEKARETIRGTVKVGVRVQVDPAGDVIAASLDSPGPSRYFANLAMNAAREWKFAPATAEGENGGREWILRFEFTQDGTKTIPAPARP